MDDTGTGIAHLTNRIEDIRGPGRKFQGLPRVLVGGIEFSEPDLDHRKIVINGGLVRHPNQAPAEMGLGTGELALLVIGHAHRKIRIGIIGLSGKNGLCILARSGKVGTDERELKPFTWGEMAKRTLPNGFEHFQNFL